MDHPNNIRALRKFRGLSQQQLADMIGSSQSMIDRLEKGERPLTQKWMRAIADALKCKPYQLVQEDFDIATLSLPYSESRSTLPESSPVRVEQMPLFATIRRGVGKVDMDAGASSPMERPSYLVGVKGAFGVRIVEKTLLKLDLNEIACVDPTYIAVAGNIVAAVYTDGTIEVLRLISESKTEWTFKREVPREQTFSLPKVQVRDVLKVRGQEYPS